MSLSAPPNRQQSRPLRPAPPRTFKARLAGEYRHWNDMTTLTFVLLLLPSVLLLYVDPLLPIAAYALWLWVSSSWAWRDRWASIWALARRGGMFVGLVLICAALSSAQVWIFPDVTAALRAFWRAYLPGDLSLSPLDGPSLVARTLLLLPLAPLLACYYERVDPRTRVQPQRILTARDIEPKKPTVKQDAASQEPTARAKPKSTAKAAPREPAKQHSESPPPPAQITIEGYLASDKDPVPARPAPSPRQKQKAAQAETPAPTPDPFKKHIDWNDVAE